jgi:phosphomannomutase
MIVLKYLYEIRGIRGCVVKTVSLTSMVDKYCAKHNIELFETPVGFKYTAELMTDGIHNVIVGGEESGGLGNALHIPERDGLFNAGLVLEAMAKSGKSLKTMCDELTEEFGTHIYRRIDRKVTEEIKQRVLSEAKSKPKVIAGYEVKAYNDKDGFKFIFANGWLLIRASGTEPILRFYSEAENIEKVNNLLTYFLK